MKKIVFLKKIKARLLRVEGALGKHFAIIRAHKKSFQIVIDKQNKEIKELQGVALAEIRLLRLENSILKDRTESLEKYVVKINKSVKTTQSDITSYVDILGDRISKQANNIKRCNDMIEESGWEPADIWKNDIEQKTRQATDCVNDLKDRFIKFDRKVHDSVLSLAKRVDAVDKKGIIIN